MSKVNKSSKTQQKVQTFFDISKRYALMSDSTGIDKKRLSEIRRGVGEKPTRSEIGKISKYKIPFLERKTGDQISIEDIKRSTGMSRADIQHALKGGSAKITKMYLDDDNTYLLKTVDNANYRLMMIIHVNLQTSDVGIGLSKKFDFKILGDTGTRYEEFMGPSGRRYSFTITVFRMHQYTNLKGQVETAVKNILAHSHDAEIEQSQVIDVLLDLVGYA